MANINIEEIRQYNNQLKAKKEQASTLAVTVDVYTRELDNKCSELSKELGIEVTPDNLEQVFEEFATKLEKTLETGKAVLKKISEEENAGDVYVAESEQSMAQQNAYMQQVQPMQSTGVNEFTAQQTVGMQNTVMNGYMTNGQQVVQGQPNTVFEQTQGFAVPAGGIII